jgi:hypothetical protein
MDEGFSMLIGLGLVLLVSRMLSRPNWRNIGF